MAAPKKVRVKYIYDPAYKMVAVNGMYGGATPRGDLRVDLFAEYTEPQSFTVQVEGESAVEEKPTGSPIIVRRIQVGFLVSPDHVRTFAEWFSSKADEIDKLVTERSKMKRG
jgi:hypothetical protein